MPLDQRIELATPGRVGFDTRSSMGVIGMGADRLADILQNRLLLLGMTLIVMLEEDAAMLAFMFC